MHRKKEGAGTGCGVGAGRCGVGVGVGVGVRVWHDGMEFFYVRDVMVNSGVGVEKGRMGQRQEQEEGEREVWCWEKSGEAKEGKKGGEEREQMFFNIDGVERDGQGEVRECWERSHTSVVS